ncbi:hypothetical protein OG936_37385 [Streptomyces sp. NBC_00846]|nr:hypothetical protein OG936_37385 [Streptomyces sp. NBC_00846]
MPCISPSTALFASDAACCAAATAPTAALVAVFAAASAFNFAA